MRRICDGSWDSCFVTKTWQLATTSLQCHTPNSKRERAESWKDTGASSEESQYQLCLSHCGVVCAKD
jgi:hypothetical protein